MTNEASRGAFGGGNQRTSAFLEVLENFEPGKIHLTIHRIDFNQYSESQFSGVEYLSFAADIEFAMNLMMSIRLNQHNFNRLKIDLENSDVVFVDNCYLSPLLELLKENANPKPTIIYLSHNYEFGLKSTTSQILDWNRATTKKYLSFVKDLEQTIWRSANYRVVCSQSDGENLGSCEDFILIPNGANIRKGSSRSRDYVLNYLGASCYSLFVASAHPPNIDGFMRGIGMDLGFLPPGSRLVIVGSSGTFISSKIERTKFRETFLNKSSILQNISEQELTDLYCHTSSVILPIYSGSGTNIKSVEALLSGRRVLSTDFALRGLDFPESDQVTVCNTMLEFKSEIKRSFGGPLDFPVMESNSVASWDSVKIMFQTFLVDVLRLERLI